MSNWKIITPVAFENILKNPSAEHDLRYWAGINSGSVSRAPGSARYGYYGFRGSPSAGVGSSGIRVGSLTFPAGTNLVSFWIKGVSDTTYEVGDLGDLRNFGSITSNGGWQLFQGTAYYAFTAVTRLDIRRISPTSDNAPFYIDAVQVGLIEPENAEYEHTYTDGTQPRVLWLGSVHNSYSRRELDTRAGGVVKDFWDDFGVKISAIIDVGVNPQQTNIDQYATVPGGQLNGIGFPQRPFTITGTTIGSGDDCDLHEARKKLTENLAPDSVADSDGRPQPVTLRYTGATTEKQITAYYDTGLQADLGPEDRIHEPVALRFIAEDPYWYSVTESAGSLVAAASATFYDIARRNPYTGMWDEMGVSSGGPVYAMLFTRSGSLWIGGSFTGWDSSANVDYFAAWRPGEGALSADTWQSVGGVSVFDAPVWALAEAPNGDVYAAGEFSTGGGGTQDYIARWDGSAWEAVGNPTNGAASITSIRALSIARNGDVTIGGSFSNFANVTNADNIATWDVSAGTWTALGSGLGRIVYALAIDNEQQTWAGGSFTTDSGGAGRTLRKVAYYSPTAGWLEPGGGLDGNVRALLNSRRGMYAGGQFTTTADGSITGLNLIARYNNASWQSLGSGLVGGSVNALALATDGWLWAGGDVSATVDGNLSRLRNLAIWTGDTWIYSDLAITTGRAANVRSLEIGHVNPSIDEIYDVFVGFSAVRALNYSGQATVSHAGTARAYPQVIIRRTAGTSTDVLKWLRNETTGKTLAFSDLEIQNGDRVVIDFERGNVTATSDFIGDVSDILSPGTPASQFYLVPGDNDISLFIEQAGASTYDIVIVWRDTYKGFDD